MNRKSPLSKIMTKQVIVANLDNSFTQVMEFFNTWRIQHLPVTFSDQLIGICSINDVLGFMYKHLSTGEKFDRNDLDNKFVMKDVMTKDPVFLSPDNFINEAYKVLSDGKFQSLPIVDNGKLIGIVTNKDLVKSYNELF